ncbi:MAG: TonB-dependent receptor plug domain-containing protein, partial [Endomicrobium sp.]|nr:TonB-dependent receptor plug domain-containing protein [Endomicrobium sp.]
MKKIISALLFVVFAANAAFAQDMFLSLTKTQENIDELPTNVTVITQEDIENKHVGTLGELLENETGIFYKTNGTTGDMPTVFMRGAAKSARTLVLIDGRRANTGGDGGANFMAIPAAAIERVEIIRGAGSVIYGSGAFGGVINVITKTAKEDVPGAAFGASYGADQTYNPYAAMSYY